MPSSQRKSEPAPTLSSVTSVLTPIFDGIFTNIEAKDGAKVDNAAYIQVHTACYKYLTTARRKPHQHSDIGIGIGHVAGEEPSDLQPPTEEQIEDNARNHTLGADLYKFLDEYLLHKVLAIASDLATKDNKIDIMKHILQEFKWYQTNTRVIARMLGYLDRYYVLTVSQEGAGWLRESDLDAELLEPKESFYVSKAYKQKEEEHLVKWGYTKGPGIGISRDDALSSAQSASSPNRIIPLQQLALRRFRTEVVEPLIVSSSEMVQWVKSNLLVNQEELSGEEKMMVVDFRHMLHRVGVLETFINSSNMFIFIRALES
ncbi:hypothetical protein BDQ17DRAFT_1330007 [Cyathus striatus]|nr:hypothetical protein BDQ17DRAFT_1330007 [Cyathus striatus]